MNNKTDTSDWDYQRPRDADGNYCKSPLKQCPQCGEYGCNFIGAVCFDCYRLNTLPLSDEKADM